ncbi:MAG: DNA mismatch repair protein MutS [Myxococcota bacterium]|nr:DNA mismatch repair protein MutS [Myxococcota bacterium]
MKSASALDTPMMRQYLSIKETQKEAVLFYRMGDFYELFLDDAERVAPLLDLTLTTRDKGKPDAIPMCGVPVHSADGYVKRLAELGYRVAICEQVETPSTTGGRRLLRREVVEVITPGLVGDPAGIEAHVEVAVVAIAVSSSGEGWGLATLDASTGDFRTTCVPEGPEAEGRVGEELQRIQPREVLLGAERRVSSWASWEEALPGAALTVIDDEAFDPSRVSMCPDGFDPDAHGNPEMCAAAGILSYLDRNQPATRESAPRLRSYRLGDSLVLDAATRTHLELFANTEDGSRQHTLIDLLDESSTPLGSRRLARWLRYPLRESEPVRERQDGVAVLADGDRMRERLRVALSPVRDLERGLARAIRPNATPRDVAALRDSLAAIPGIAAELAGGADEADRASVEERPTALAAPVPLDALVARLQEALVEDPPVVHRGSRGAGETGYIRTGFRPELDELREGAAKGREWIANLEAQERERTGISALKARFHPVHGYSLEVPKTQQSKVPEYYERKQTLASVERFTTEGLREIESDVMGASERAASLEREIFEGLRREVVGEVDAVREVADRIGDLDALASLAHVARREAWVRPEVHAGESLEIRGGRHPVVESILRSRGADDFVPNDCDLDPGSIQVCLLTGPNMSGKSTYLRQVALIALMAQVGSWVPAESARVGAIDRIFTRVGASDRLSRGESTFMVEMRETAEILGQASRRSLVLLDEIGRGTSTYDGLAIAWAVLEYLHDTPGLQPRTLFATHFHELIDLGQAKARVRNAHFEAREWGDDVVFLRRLVPGGASRSYGIQVARLAGLPSSVIDRAAEILKSLESSSPGAKSGEPDPAHPQLSFELDERAATPPPAHEEILEELRKTDPNRTAPLDALTLVARWREILDREGPS